jgi:uncharacterized membrane protein YccC
LPMSTTTVTTASHDSYHAHSAWYFFTSGNDLMFALRTTVAGLAALLTGMWLQLDVPRWALTTVFVVSPPVRGNALRKTASRVIGTMIGCVVGVVLAAMFPQDRIGFSLTFAAWLGACAYWATLKRGFVSYGAILAAFTSAIVAANVSSAPQDVFDTAIYRGSATLVGVFFALLASDIAARSDDVPGDLADRACSVASDVLEWAASYLERHLHSNQIQESDDAPFTGDILALDELTINAMAERPALKWIKNSIVGLPTALLSLQSNVLCVGRAIRFGKIDSRNVQRARLALVDVRDVLKTGAQTSVPALREQAASLARLRTGLPALTEIVSAMQYLLASIEAILTRKAPNELIRSYPAPKFLAQRERAKINLARAAVGMLLTFLIWDATAWTEGALFMAYAAVALVIFVSLDDPVAGNRLNLLGTVIGAFAGLASKFFLLTWHNNPAWLVIVLFPSIFVAVWVEVKPEYVKLAIFYINALLIMVEPTNPQQYDFAQELNTLVALVAAYAFVSIVFIAIGTPKSGPERIDELLGRMCRHLGMAQKIPRATPDQQLVWETGMYDGIQQLQAESKNPRDRALAVELLLTGRRFFDSIPSPSAKPVMQNQLGGALS